MMLYLLIVTLATEYYLNKKNNTSLLSTISKALDYWFDNNYTPDACLDQGGLDACPCGTPGFWNTNWFGQVRSYHSCVLIIIYILICIHI